MDEIIEPLLRAIYPSSIPSRKPLNIWLKFACISPKSSEEAIRANVLLTGASRFMARPLNIISSRMGAATTTYSRILSVKLRAEDVVSLMPV